MKFEASVAFRIPTEKRPSTIPGAGAGIFALEGVPRGKFLGMDFPNYRKLCIDRDVLRLSEENQRFSWRHIEQVCFEAHDQRSPADLMNHAFEPNILWHVGYYFASSEIRPGDELFVDYRLLFSPLWDGDLADEVTGRQVEGLDWRESLIKTARQLAELLEETGPTAEDDTPDQVSALCQALRDLPQGHSLAGKGPETQL